VVVSEAVDRKSLKHGVTVVVDVLYGPGWRSQHRDRLQSGRFGFRTPLKATDFPFSVPVQTDSGTHPGSCTSTAGKR
jgi:hypothetical protein